MGCRAAQPDQHQHLQQRPHRYLLRPRMLLDLSHVLHSSCDCPVKDDIMAAERPVLHVMLPWPRWCSDRVSHWLPGTLPPQWGNLDLNVLDLDRNALTGELGHDCLHKLTSLGPKSHCMHACFPDVGGIPWGMTPGLSCCLQLVPSQHAGLHLLAVCQSGRQALDASDLHPSLSR